MSAETGAERGASPSEAPGLRSKRSKTARACEAAQGNKAWFVAPARGSRRFPSNVRGDRPQVWVLDVWPADGLTGERSETPQVAPKQWSKTKAGAQRRPAGLRNLSRTLRSNVGSPGGRQGAGLAPAAWNPKAPGGRNKTKGAGAAPEARGRRRKTKDGIFLW